MRLVRILAFGAALAAAALLFGRVTSGLPAAAALLVAIFLSAITLGLAVAALFDAATERQRAKSSHWLWRPQQSTRARCGSCRRFLDHVGDLWVCPACDRVAIDV